MILLNWTASCAVAWIELACCAANVWDLLFSLMKGMQCVRRSENRQLHTQQSDSEDLHDRIVKPLLSVANNSCCGEVDSQSDRQPQAGVNSLVYSMVQCRALQARSACVALHNSYVTFVYYNLFQILFYIYVLAQCRVTCIFLVHAPKTPFVICGLQNECGIQTCIWHPSLLHMFFVLHQCFPPVPSANLAVILVAMHVACNLLARIRARSILFARSEA